MEKPAADGRDGDRAEIYAHIDRVFRAYQARDLEEIRRTHTEDWRGFQLPSRSLVRGIDAYMQTARQVASGVAALEHWEFLEREVEFHGDLALVWYVAREVIVDAEGQRKTLLLRAIDLYRREPSGWNQCGSHITALPEP
jgi:ketosteroid isomerase-like protein